MIHEWWGLNQNIKDMADKLAADGYMVLAVDLYEGHVAQNPKEAQQYVGEVNQNTALANMKAAYDFLKNNRAGKVASLGWCFGGGKSLAMAVSGVPLSATVLYYGTPLITDKSQLSAIKWPVLGIFGDKDQSIPVAKVKEFQTVLNELHIPNEIHIYPGVGHAFANPTNQNYAPEPTKDAWTKTLAFLKKNL
jgi:carboxymethylenebutenolidase